MTLTCPSTHVALRTNIRSRRYSQPFGSSQPSDVAISLHVGHKGYFWGSRPGTQTLPHRARTGVALIIAPTTEFSSATNSPSLGV